jgi:hypothetical protein
MTSGITGGTKTEKAFLSAKSSRPFSCLEAHNSCTGIQVQELDRKGRPKKESTAQSTQLNLSSSPHDDDHCVTCVSDEAKNNAEVLASYCNDPKCRATCGAWKVDRLGYSACTSQCDHEESACELAKQGNLYDADREEALANKANQDLNLAAKRMKQREDERKVLAEREQIIRNSQRPVQSYTPPAQTYSPPVEADLGYPPGCRNKPNYDLCALQGQGCSLGSRRACQDICRGLCNY